VGALIAGGGVLATSGVEPAQAANVSCYGDFCSGKYANETGCYQDARTIAEAAISRSGLTLSVTAAKEPGVSVGVDGNAGEVGILELRHSETCGTNWARLNAKGGRSAGLTGINFVGVQQDGGYTQKRDIGGWFNGSPAAVSYSPMVYGRSRSYRAFIEAKDFAIAYQNGTYWTER
jgi:hypothetical protein